MAFPTTNLASRYEAKSETGYTSGDLLATIVDQSGNLKDLSQATSSKRPTWQSNVLNGHAAFRFDGVDDLVTRTTTYTNSTYTLSLVQSSGASEATTRKWAGGLNRSTTYIYGATEGVTSGEWGSFVRSSSGTVQIPSSGVNTTAFCVWTIEWDGSTVFVYRNGTLVSSAALAGSMDFTAGSAIAMGALEAIPTECFSGDIALMGLWTPHLGSTGRADLHSYVQDTYGITVSDYSGGATVARSVAGVGSFPTSGAIAVPS